MWRILAYLSVAEGSKDVLHNLPEKRSERVQQLIRAIPKDGGSRSSLSPELALKCHTKHDGYYDVYGRMSWDDVSPTITGGCINPSKGRFLPEYTFSLRRGKYAAAEMIGNALPPLFSRLQAEVIRDHLTQK